MDEAGFSLHPKLGLVWAKKGSKPKIPTAKSPPEIELGWLGCSLGWLAWFNADR